MATFTGTSGNDAFTGGTGIDTFNLLTKVTGNDRIDGGAGVDEPKLSYTSLLNPYGLYSTIAAAKRQLQWPDRRRHGQLRRFCEHWEAVGQLRRW